MYVGFIDVEQAYDRVNREALWQVLRMYDVGGKMLNGIKNMYVCVFISFNFTNLQLSLITWHDACRPHRGRN